MENKIDQKIDTLLKQVGTTSTTEKPSHDFTENLMLRINQESNQQSTFQYRPLISIKMGWFIVISLVASLIYVANSTTSTTSWTPHFTLDIPDLGSVFEQFIDINISATVSYAFLSLGLMLLIQITWLEISHAKKWQSQDR